MILRNWTFFYYNFLNVVNLHFPDGTPIYTDVASAKVMKEPARADWARTTPISWTTTDRNKYKDWFNKTYPNVYDWSLNEVHHMRPRNLGGTNDYSNLIPIPIHHHRSVVSPWFVAY
ncbi:HNH endonuclease signature motif containing protein [Paenibacillus shunpengii]|uniref:HNH endonuclease signature motif containing protein n=1 Tax=Paenibacillus shunpengii TaxID=2054424 RepID=A0ABW5SLX0_9BACL